MTPGQSHLWSNTRLTPLSESDLDLLNAWQNDPSVRDLTMGFRGPVSRATTAAWLQALSNTGTQQSSAPPARFVFAIRHEASLVGTIQLHSVNWLQRTASLGITVGDARSRGKGIGFAATALLLDYTFRGLDLHRVELSCLADNVPACRLYHRLGFVREGVQRAAYFAAGERHDVALYGMLHHEWHSPMPDTAECLIHTFTVEEG